MQTKKSPNKSLLSLVRGPGKKKFNREETFKQYSNTALLKRYNHKENLSLTPTSKGRMDSLDFHTHKVVMRQSNLHARIEPDKAK